MLSCVEGSWSPQLVTPSVCLRSLHPQTVHLPYDHCYQEAYHTRQNTSATSSVTCHARQDHATLQCTCSTTAWSVAARSLQVHYVNAHTMSLGCLIACAQLGGAQSSELVHMQDVHCGTIVMDAHCCGFTCTITRSNQSHQLCWCCMHTDSCIIYT